MFSYYLGHKDGPGGENTFWDVLDTCRGHRTECDGTQILHVLGFSGGLVRIVSFWYFLCSDGVCVGEG